MLNLKDGTLWQWDTGRKLVVTLEKGHTIDKVQFYNGMEESARTGKLETTADGTILAYIPNVLLQYPNNLSVYLMTIDEDGTKTTETLVIAVNQRAKPEDYVFTNDEILTYREYDDRLKFIENDYVTEEELLDAKKEANNYTDKVIDENYSEALQNAIEANEFASEALEKASTAEMIAKGRNRSHIFDTFVDMALWLSTESNKEKCLVGDNLYIKEVNEPDWWISKILEEPAVGTGYYFEISQLETQKVDLTEIEEEIDSLENEIDSLEATQFQNLTKVDNPNAYNTGNYTGWIQIDGVQYGWMQFDSTTFQSQIAIANGTGVIIQRTKINNNTWEGVNWRQSISEDTTMSGGGVILKDGNIWLGPSTGWDKLLTDILANMVTADGSMGWIDNTNDANKFYTGVGLFSPTSLNLPQINEWYMILSGGVNGTTCQLAVGLFSGTLYCRSCAAGQWSFWSQPDVWKYELPVGSFVLHQNQESVGFPMNYGVWECKGHFDIQLSSGGGLYSPYLWYRKS